MKRFGPGILVQAGGQNLLFNSGRGVTQRLFQLKIPFGKINHVFLTHLHSDHVVGLPDLWLSGWLGAPWARRKVPRTQSHSKPHEGLRNGQCLGH